jgi:hypothetical protein
LLFEILDRRKADGMSSLKGSELLQGVLIVRIDSKESDTLVFVSLGQLPKH